MSDKLPTPVDSGATLCPDLTIKELSPFGERWTPTEGEVQVDEWLSRDLEGVVRSVREAGVVVLENSVIGPDWMFAHPDRINPRPNVVQPLSFGNIPVQMMHAEGPAPSVSYARTAELHAAGSSHFPRLLEALKNFPPELLDHYGVQFFISPYVEGYPHYQNDDALGPLFRLAQDINTKQGQLTGWQVWKAGQDLDAIKAELPMLIALHKVLGDFVEAISRDAEKYTHTWRTNPGTTVLAAQDALDHFDRDNRLVFHFKDPQEGDSYGPIRMNFIFSQSILHAGVEYGRTLQLHNRWKSRQGW